MKKHLLLFAALFAIVSGNNLFAKQEASGHLTDPAYNPTSQSITATTLPFTLADWNATKFGTNVWVPASDKELVTWSANDSSFLFAGKDKDEKYNDNDCEQPFVIKLAGAGKKLTVKPDKATTTKENYNGSGWKIYEWDGTKWVLNKEQGYDSKDFSTNDFKLDTRYIMIAAYAHGGGNRKFAKFEITKFVAPDNFDATPTFTLESSKSWGQQYVNKSVTKNIAPTSLNDGAKVSNWSAAISGDNASMFSVNCDEYTGLCAVTYTPTAAGSHTATLTLTATDNEVSPSVSAQQSISLSGTGDATATIELTKQGEATASTSHDFGSVIGLNAATSLILNVSKHNFESELAYEWKTADEAFGYTVNGNQLTITAKPNAAQDAQSIHTGVLKVKGKSNGSATYDVTKDFTVTLTVNPRTIPTKTWNIGSTLFAQNVYSNIFTTNSDAQVTISVGNDNQYLTYASNKLTTSAITTDSQAAGSITITAPATDTYAAINEVREITLVANPAYLPVTIDTKEKFDLLFSGQSTQSTAPNAQWNNGEGAIELLRRSTANDRYFELTIKGAPYQISFDYKNDETAQYGGSIQMWIKESEDGNTWTDVVTGIKPSNLSEYTPFGPYELLPATKKIRVYVKGTYAQHLFKNLTIIASAPTLNVAESSVELKANTNLVYDKTVHFSVLKYSTIKVKIEGADFGLVKGTADATNEITFTSADDGLNNSTFTNCSFKVRYSKAASGAIGKIATIKFFDCEDHQIGSALSVSIAAVPVLTFEKPTNGSYTYKYEGGDIIPVNETKTRDLADAPYEVTLTAGDAPSGYKFFGWYEKNGDTKTYLSTANPYTPTISTTKTIGVEFVTTSTPTFIVKGQEGAYLNLNDACTVAASSSKTVVLASDGTLAAGDYEIPAGVTLLIPFSSDYKVTKENSDYGSAETITLFRKLTMASGAKIIVYGELCVNSVGVVSGNGGTMAGRTRGAYGQISMLEGSEISIENGAKLYVWGFVSGIGNIIAKSGAKVYEPLEFDFRGGTHSSGVKSTVLPLNQYYVQHIEAHLKVCKGATDNVYTAATAGGMSSGASIDYIASNGLFNLVSNNSYIERFYDGTKDRIIYDVNGDTELKGLNISVGGQGMDSKSVILPLTNNMTMRVHSGTTSVKYATELLADARIEIAEDAVFDIQNNFFVYDRDEWVGKQCAMSGDLNATTYAAGRTFTNVTTTGRTSAKMEDAAILVNGTLKTSSNGYLYTTTGKANIYSTGNGKIILTNGSGSKSSTPQNVGTVDPSKGAAIQDIPIEPAQLKNENESYTSTSGAVAGTTYVYGAGKWLIATEDNVEKTLEITPTEVKESGETPQSIDNATYHVVIDNQTATAPYEKITINQGTTLDIAAGTTVSAVTLALSTTPSVVDAGNDKVGICGQISGAGSIVAENAYIDIQMSSNGSMNSNLYYAFAVPFKVNVDGGVQKVIGSAVSPAQNDVHFRAYTYNGDKRAVNGKDGSAWEQVTSGTFNPGVFYLIEFADNSCNTFRFTKAANQALNNAGDIAVTFFGGDSKNGNHGWNGIANNALYNSKLTATEEYVQVLDPAGKSFTAVPLSSTSFAIGTPMMIQATADGTVTHTSPASAPAEHLAAQGLDTKTFGNYTIRIKAEGAAKMADQLFISASENDESHYVIGKDLTKMFMGNATVAQLWVNDYGKKLSVNQSLLTNDIAEASMTLYAPKAGDYEVYLKDIPEDATIYLMQNGAPIANLNNGVFSVHLNKGENTTYGLRINTKNKPNVTTSLDEALVNNAKAQKVLLNGVVYIVRDGQLFDILGQKH